MSIRTKPYSVNELGSERPQSLPLSFAQQRMWFLQNLEPESTAYNVPLIVRFDGHLDTACFADALQIVVDRHESLRTVFSAGNEGVEQRILRRLAVRTPIVDLGNLTRAEEQLRIRLIEESRYKFDLINGPLIRSVFFRLSEDRHVWLFTTHHIISDGWSMAILNREISAVYNAWREGHQPDLPILNVQYADFASWQHRLFDNHAVRDSLEYWCDQLQDAPPLLSIPTDYARPAVESHRGAVRQFRISRTLSQSIDSKAHELGVFPFVFCLAVFNTLLARLSDARDITVGCPVAGRSHPDLELLFGFFVNTLPMRIRLDEGESFSEFLERVKSVVLDALEHQNVPLERIVEAVAPERDLSRAPLFQSVFSVQDSLIKGLELAGVLSEQIPQNSGDAKYDIAVVLNPMEHGYGGHVEYSTDLFSGKTIERLIARFELFLSQAVEQPDTDWTAWTLITREESNLIETWGHGKKLGGQVESVPRKFARVAQHSPKAVACRNGDCIATYAELSARATSLTLELRAAGVRSGHRVAIFSSDPIERVISALAVWGCRAAYVPVDPAYPDARISFMLSDAEVQVCIVSSELKGRVSESLTKIVATGEAKESDWFPESIDISPPETAYVIYTSGSTGRPKGISVSHFALGNLVNWHASEYGLRPGTRASQLAGFGFDAAVWEIWPYLATAGEVHFADEDTRLDPKRLVQWISENRITHSFLPTPLAELALAGAWPRDCELEWLLTGGDQLTRRPANECKFTLVNHYGPTENAVVATSAVVECHGKSLPPIGRPIANNLIYVLDESLNPVPAGVAGQLFIAGDSLADGYLRLPALSASNFIPCPFSAEPGARMYATGDKVRFDAGGNLEFLGRLDEQIQIRGFRVEPGEIESVLIEHPGVSDAAVIARESDQGDTRLVAFISGNSEYSSNAGLREWISGWSELYDDTYQVLESVSDPKHAFIGWNSSYDGLPIPTAEMSDWADEAAQRIRSLDPRNVLEIGCGSGLILFRLADECERYTATDFSSNSIRYIKTRAGSHLRPNCKPDLIQCEATDFSSLMARQFDTIIINSVIQYFPSNDYLLDVISRSVDHLDAEGSIFIGDVRHLGLLDAFHATIEIENAPANAIVKDVASQVMQGVIGEQELLVAPSFFTNLPNRFPRISRVEVIPKYFKANNELTRYRYDVIIYVDEKAWVTDIEWLDAGSSDQIRRYLEAGSAEAIIGLRRVANSRLVRERQLLSAIKGKSDLKVSELDLPSRTDEAPVETWLKMVDDLPFEVNLSWAAGYEDGAFDVLLVGEDAGKIPTIGGDSNPPFLTNRPIRIQTDRALVNAVREHCSICLPDYLRPTHVELLSYLPLTHNGKIDRVLLTAFPLTSAPDRDSYVEPNSEVERVLCDFWSELLNIDRVGINDRFFELGGHSLLATQLITRVNAQFETALPVRTVFEAQTVALLAVEVERARLSSERVQSAIEVVPRSRSLPLSFAQQRLWFLDQLEGASAIYNIPSVLRFSGDLDLVALRGSLNNIVDRHESLRTHFEQEQGAPVQIVDEQKCIELRVIDLSGLERVLADALEHTLMRDDANQVFDLATGPMLRARIIHRSRNDHVLLLSMHHIASDAWSMGLLVDELRQSYEAFALGRQPALPALPIQYADFSVWHRTWLSGTTLRRQLDYWTEELADLPPRIDLPTDFPRPAGHVYDGDAFYFDLPDRVYEQMVAVCRAQGITPFMFTLAVYFILLNRLSGQLDFAVGTPVANRPRPETEGLIGFFVNTLVLRSPLQIGMRFPELIEAVRELCLAAFSHQDIPFEHLVDALKPDRTLSQHTPLFQVLFAFQSKGVTDFTLPGVDVVAENTPVTVAKFDLEMLLSEDGGRLKGVVKYSSALFGESTISRIVDSYVALLTQLVERPGRALDTLSMIGRDDSSLVHRLATESEPQRSLLSVVELFETAAVKDPGAHAIKLDAEDISYGQLLRRADRWAAVMKRNGLRPEQPVAIGFARGELMLTGILASMRAGGVCLPIDRELPDARVAAILEDANARFLLGLNSLDASGEALSLELLDAGDDDCFAFEPPQPDQLAYLIYTSGTTGKPKGVAQTHRCLANLIIWQFSAYAPTTCQFASIGFDVAFQEIFGTWAEGGCLVIPSELERRDPFLLLELLSRARVERCYLPVVAFHQLCDALDRDGKIPARLCEIITAGEALVLTETNRRALRLLPGIRLANHYGPAESHVVNTETLSGNPSGWPDTPAIGSSIKGVQQYVVDASLQLSPVGVPGELLLGGKALARGYLGQGGETAEKFVPNPFSELSGSRLYRTGDRVRLLEDGRLEYLGRTDQQIKVRGFRVEPGEVAAMIRRHPLIEDCAIRVIEASGQNVLAAYVVFSSEGVITPAELRKFLVEKLPDYMVPSRIVPMDRIPVNQNGKVALEQLPLDIHNGDSGNTAEFGDTTSRMVALWERLLEIDDLEPDENFFEVGGHSLLGTKLMALIADEFKVELPVRVLYENPCVFELADRVEAAIRKQATPELTLHCVDTSKPLPLSFGQQGLWFIEKMENVSGMYHLSMALRLTNELDTGALRRALIRIVERHQSLRTRFAEIESEPRQIIEDQVELSFPVIDLRHLLHQVTEVAQQSMREKELQRHLFALLNKPYAVSGGRLFHVSLLRLTGREHVIAINMHHLVSDGWSMGIFARELAAFYTEEASGVLSDIAPLKWQYADYSESLRKAFAEGHLESQLEYWQNRLASMPPLLELPIDYSRPAKQDFAGGAYPFEIDGELVNRLDRVARSSGATLYMVLLAAFQLWLGRITGRRDIPVGTPVANRNMADLESMIGMFLNTLVIRSDVDLSLRFIDFLETVRKEAMSAYSNQDIPFEHVVTRLKPSRSLSYSPVYQVMFSFQRDPVSDLEFSGLNVDPVVLESRFAKYDLSAILHENESGIEGVLEYSSALFDRDTIARFSRQFVNVLSAIAQAPERIMGEIDLLSDREQRWMLSDWSSGTVSPVQRHLVELIELQTVTNRERSAVCDSDGSYSYHELNNRANQYAHWLGDLGLGAECRVGVCMQRSRESLAVMLGILKSGAAYVPMDINYPEERLGFMLEDAGLQAILGDEAGLDNIPSYQLQFIEIADIQEIDDELSIMPVSNPQVFIDPAQSVYVIYTSGTTGQPKGTIVSHGALANLVTWHMQTYRLGPDVRVGQFAGSGFDACAWEIWSALSAGAELYLAGDELKLDPVRTIDWLQRNEIVQAFLPTPLAEAVLKQPWPQDFTLTHLLTGGDRLRISSCPSSGTQLINHYGPTENAVVATAGVVDGYSDRLPTIGRPIANVQCLVLDASARLCAVGVVGELCLAGRSLAREYLGRPGLTASRFVPNPYAAKAGERMYRTGDLVRWLRSGELEFIGRVDTQVKVLGYRIELGEIEAALSSLSDVHQAVVTDCTDGNGNRALAAYVTTKGGQSLDVASLKQALRSQLPDYMIPSGFAVVESFPVTTNGKVDRQALPPFDFAAADFKMPETEEETLLVDTFKHLLDYEKIGVNDNFFDLGGNSLMGFEVCAEINEAFGIELPIREIFEKPVIAELAEHIANLRLLSHDDEDELSGHDLTELRL